MKKYIFCIAVMAMSVFSQVVNASLMISPTRVVFDERQRTAKVFLINNGSEAKTYRLGWKEKRALAKGGYQDLAPEQAGPWKLSELMRMTPRQVYLAPGERQVVKLALRRKQGMRDGEYRSHLLFQALPTENPDQSVAIGISLNMILSYSIPVMYRKGVDVPQVTVSSAQYTSNIHGKPVIAVKLKRSGAASALGKLTAHWQPNGKKEWTKVAIANNYAIYPEVDEASVELNILQGQAIRGSGQLKLMYTGQEEYRDTVFSQRIFNVIAQ
ncbi:fimbria/pilus periplasmic chaperone [Pseudoalteromonas luteoviolacea]|uniref:fimbrial biogenesis chaperone n=1 Tax=Pseudoalteromonas luteoviolacea TaxID=43657 RepID=UPI001EED2EA7|nr:fimbria/pilus periplasmic chaperone [Pseudoalteromonas luteoviolacea]MCF6438112.1 fimbria/pilus periplasmic chaperone [Pseudoalteromonas luteoviolacea]